MVGQVVGVYTDVVERGAIRRYCQAMDDMDPLYLDDAYASNTRYGGVIAPPLFVGGLAPHPPGTPEPGDDGFGGRIQAEQVELPLKRVVVGGQEWEFFAPVRPGDEITITSRLAELREAEGRRSGRMVFNVKESVFVNQRGETVAILRHTRVLR